MEQDREAYWKCRICGQAKNCSGIDKVCLTCGRAQQQIFQVSWNWRTQRWEKLPGARADSRGMLLGLRQVKQDSSYRAHARCLYARTKPAEDKGSQGLRFLRAASAGNANSMGEALKSKSVCGLLLLGADPNVRVAAGMGNGGGGGVGSDTLGFSTHDFTALMLAAAGDYTECAQLLLRYPLCDPALGAFVPMSALLSGKDGHNGGSRGTGLGSGYIFATALHVACALGADKTTKILLRHPSATPLLLAGFAQTERSHSMEALPSLSSSSSISSSISSISGQHHSNAHIISPFHLACSAGQVTSATLVLRATVHALQQQQKQQKQEQQQQQEQRRRQTSSDGDGGGCPGDEVQDEGNDVEADLGRADADTDAGGAGGAGGAGSVRRALDAQDESGRTALMFAAGAGWLAATAGGGEGAVGGESVLGARGRLELVKVLVQLGSDCEIRDRDGHTALAYALALSCSNSNSHAQQQQQHYMYGADAEAQAEAAAAAGAVEVRRQIVEVLRQAKKAALHSDLSHCLSSSSSGGIAKGKDQQQARRAARRQRKQRARARRAQLRGVGSSGSMVTKLGGGSSGGGGGGSGGRTHHFRVKRRHHHHHHQDHQAAASVSLPLL